MKIVKTDPKFLAVTGKALGSDEKFFEATVRLNPEYDPTVAGSKEFQTVNATQISKRHTRLRVTPLPMEQKQRRRLI